MTRLAGKRTSSILVSTLLLTLTFSHELWPREGGGIGIHPGTKGQQIVPGERSDSGPQTFVELVKIYARMARIRNLVNMLNYSYGLYFDGKIHFSSPFLYLKTESVSGLNFDDKELTLENLSSETMALIGMGISDDGQWVYFDLRRTDELLKVKFTNGFIIDFDL